MVEDSPSPENAGCSRDQFSAETATPRVVRSDRSATPPKPRVVQPQPSARPAAQNPAPGAGSPRAGKPAAK